MARKASKRKPSDNFTDRFIDVGFEKMTIEEARTIQREVTKEQKAAAARSRVAEVPVTPVQASGDIWLI